MRSWLKWTVHVESLNGRGTVNKGSQYAQAGGQKVEDRD